MLISASDELFTGSYGPMSPKIKELRIVGFDTEDDSKGTPISFAFHDGTDSFYTTDADEAVDYIYNSRRITCFVAHNLEYDIGNLFKHCDFKYINEMVYSSKLLRVSLWGSRNFFLNSASFFQGPLVDMGELVGFKKLKGDVFDPKYNIRDAEIPQVFMSKIQKRLNAMGVNLGVSIGQLAMAVYRRNFLRHKILTYNNPLCLNAYYGGRVEVFYKGIVKETVYVADINSSYPDVMRRMPYPETAIIEPSSIDTHFFGFGKFTVDVPDTLFVPPLPYRSEAGRLFFPVGIVTGWWTYAEVRRAVELGCSIVKEFEGYGTNQGVSPYSDFVDFFWNERLDVKARLKKNSKDLDAKFESLFLKLILNNRYGKDAQHKPSVLMTRYRLSDAKIETLKGVKEVKIGPFYGYTIPREKAPRTANFLWGVYTTAYARLSLLDKLIAVHEAGGTLLYCDTDSVMFTGEKAKLALKLGGELGELEIEEYDLAVFRQAKGYLLCKAASSNLKTKKTDTYQVSKVACKGVPTHYALEFFREGMIRALKPMRLKEAQIRTHATVNSGKDAEFFKDIGINIWRDVPKTMNSIYIKRSGNNGVTMPVDVAEIPLLEINSFAPFERTGDLDAFNIRAQEKKGESFKNIVIPPGWHKRTKALEDQEDFYESQEMKFLNAFQMKEIKPGETWFAGKPIRLEKGKYGDFYVIRLKKFLGQNVRGKNMLAAFPKKFYNTNENIFGKTLEIILARDYILNSPLEYTVSLT